MTPALALERLMLHPSYDRFVQRARQIAPVALLDQADAAATDAHRIIADVAVRLSDNPARPTTAGDLPGWLRLSLLDTLTAFADGWATTCRHNPAADRPSPVVGAAWKPHMVVCPTCVHLLSLRHDAAADAVCDGCGHQCAGPEHGDGIYPGMVQLGPLLYQYGTCGGCRPDAAGSGTLSATEAAEQGTPRGTGRVTPRGSRGRSRGKGRQR
ncbi:hypothetical protein GCM10010169_23360 [Micromonospora fulviviridis]|uniref:hypothetical protein n=1 Tax=Micromonospora fulviviridis TaxID=47860 RepID=UPI00166680FB|nr:hypothetical protein [Micromonospora fulviviridis]GGR78514.1 hypothetical protein GCM10010169_23360 [Micromonospora fulviviridis]